MMAWFHPGLIYLAGAPFIPLLKGRLRKAYLLLLPCLAFVNLLLMSKGVFLSNGKTWSLSFLGYNLVLGRIDPLSLVFASPRRVSAAVMSVLDVSITPL